jgi:hypothetical protein
MSTMEAADKPDLYFGLGMPEYMVSHTFEEPNLGNPSHAWLRTPADFGIYFRKEVDPDSALGQYAPLAEDLLLQIAGVTETDRSGTLDRHTHIPIRLVPTNEPGESKQYDSEQTAASLAYRLIVEKMFHAKEVPQMANPETGQTFYRGSFHSPEKGGDIDISLVETRGFDADGDFVSLEISGPLKLKAVKGIGEKAVDREKEFEANMKAIKEITDWREIDGRGPEGKGRVSLYWNGDEQNPKFHVDCVSETGAYIPSPVFDDPEAARDFFDHAMSYDRSPQERRPSLFEEAA